MAHGRRLKAAASAALRPLGTRGEGAAQKGKAPGVCAGRQGKAVAWIQGRRLTLNASQNREVCDARGKPRRHG
jgi:hypothetical protein